MVCHSSCISPYFSTFSLLLISSCISPHAAISQLMGYPRPSPALIPQLRAAISSVTIETWDSGELWRASDAVFFEIRFLSFPFARIFSRCIHLGPRRRWVDRCSERSSTLETCLGADRPMRVFMVMSEIKVNFNHNTVKCEEATQSPLPAPRLVFAGNGGWIFPYIYTS